MTGSGVSVRDGRVPGVGVAVAGGVAVAVSVGGAAGAMGTIGGAGQPIVCGALAEAPSVVALTVRTPAQTFGITKAALKRPRESFETCNIWSSS